MMLVLSRTLGERIVIAENIEIAVVQIRGNKVRLGVTAPRHVAVHRLEVRNRLQADHREQPSPPSSLQDTGGSSSTNSQNGGLNRRP
jgi:carbon storage regulator